MTFNSDLLTTIDDRVARGQERITAMGTLIDTPVGTDATVIVDGSSTAVAVKVFKTVKCRGGDRVGLVKFGSKWTVVGSFTDHGMRVLVKVTDESFTGTTFFSPVVGLSHELLPNTKYTWFAVLGTLAPVANDIMFKWTYPQSSFSWGQLNQAYTSGAGVGAVTMDTNYRRDGLSTQSSTLFSAGAAADNIVFMGGGFQVGNAGGFLNLYAAQVVSGGTSWVLGGSYVQIQEA